VRQALEQLVLAGEDLGDGIVGEDAPDRVLENVGAGELGDQVGRAVVERDRVRDDDPGQRATAEDLEGLAREQPVCSDRENAVRPLVQHRLRGGVDRHPTAQRRWMASQSSYMAPAG